MTLYETVTWYADEPIGDAIRRTLDSRTRLEITEGRALTGEEMEVTTGSAVPPPSGLENILAILALAADHHDPATDTKHDLDALAGQAAAMSPQANTLSKLLAAVFQYGPAVLALIEALKPHAKIEAPVTPPTTSIPTSAPGTTKPVLVMGLPPAPSVPEAESAIVVGELEAWPEQGWHDWQKTDEHEDGLFDVAAYVASGRALPPGGTQENPGLTVRFMTGVQPGPDGHARVPRNEPGVKFPVVTHHFAYSTGETYSFDSSADPGVKQPVPELGHVQGGDIYQLSDGWDFIIRLLGFHGDGPRTLRYWSSVGGVTSNAVDLPISHMRNN